MRALKKTKQNEQTNPQHFILRHLSLLFFFWIHTAMSEQSKERRILSYGNRMIELARSKEKFFFWAGIILMGI